MGATPMSQQSERLLKRLMEEEPEGLPWDDVVRQVRDACDVQRNTAETYIRRSEHATKELTAEGDKLVVPPGNGETVIHDEETILEMEVGAQTSKTFGELPVLEDVGHPEVPHEHETGYIRRRMGDTSSALGKKTDVHVVTSAMTDPDYGTMLIGKHGVGKDRLVLHICAKTNRPVIRLVANDDPDFVDLLVGTYAPGSDGNFRHKKGLLAVAIENGYTFILDEFNALSGKVQTMLNKILEDADQSELVIPETNEVIQPHEEFRFVATQNPNEVGYGGREDVDHATGSRFVPITLPPLESQAEKKVVASETEWSESSSELRSLLDEDTGVLAGIRTLYDVGKISYWPSTRDAIQIGRMANRLGSVEAAAELVLTGRADPANEDTIREKVRDNNW